jgi:hypothetical protein
MQSNNNFSHIAKHVFKTIEFEKLQDKWVTTSEDDFKAFFRSYENDEDLPLLYKADVEFDYDIVEDGHCDFFYDDHLTSFQKSTLEKFAVDESLKLFVTRTDSYIQTWRLEVKLPIAPNKADSHSTKFVASVQFSLINDKFKNNYFGEFSSELSDKEQEKISLLYSLSSDQ